MTVQEIKDYPLPVKSDQWAKATDAQILTVIEYASEHIEDYLDRKVASAYYLERIPGGNSNSLILSQYPIISLFDVTSTDYIESATIYDLSYFLIHREAGILEWVDKSRYYFYKSMNYTVDYQAGYETIPGPIKHATALQTVQMLQPIFRGSTNFAPAELIEGMNDTIVDLLEKYKRKRIG